jgi:ketosteroid isomerase-like protein
MTNDVAKIEFTLRQFSAACNAGDQNAIERTLDDDVVFMPPDAPAVSGKETVVQWVQSAVFDLFHQKLQMNLGQAQVVDAEALVTGSFSLEMTPKSGSNTVKGVGKHMAVFKKQADGSWKYLKAIWNFDRPLA